MKSNLLIHHGFIESTIEGFLKDYRKTIAFAGLLDDVIFSKPDEKDDESNTGPKLGDWVQCDMEGQLRLTDPLKLIRIEDHPEHGKFGFVEGQKGGIEYKHLIKVEPPAITDSKPKVQPPNIFDSPLIPKLSSAIPPAPRGGISMETESFSLSNGLSAQFQWPSVMSEAAFKKFEYFIEGIKMSVKDAVSNDSGLAVESQKDEKAS